MLFDFDDRYRDIEPVGSAINRRDGVAMSVFVHSAILLAVLFLPQYLPQRSDEAQAIPPPQRPENQPTFVFVQPKIDLPPTRQPGAPSRSGSMASTRRCRGCSRGSLGSSARWRSRWCASDSSD